MPCITLTRGVARALAGGAWLIASLVSAPAEPYPAAAPQAASTELSPETARARIEALRSEIAHHDELYFKKAAPEITDSAYDALKRELIALERSFANFAREPISAVGDDRTEGFARATHLTPMLSLQKAHTEADVREFCRRIAQKLGHDGTFIIEPKVDGVAVSVLYEKGRFARAVTRGNGVEGDDITQNVLRIRSFPRTLFGDALPERIELRGEIYLPVLEFNRLNREREADGEEPFSHPRNVAAGTIKSLDPAEVETRGLAIVFFGWGACEPASHTPATQQAFHAMAKAWGIPTLPTSEIVTSPDAVWNRIYSLGPNRNSLPFATDGAVVKLDLVANREVFGESAEGPRWALAYKFAPERVATQLKGVSLQIGRTGVITPVAELDPVVIAGSRVTRATLHNREAISRLDLRVGDFVFLEKAGEIIPAITSVDLTRHDAAKAPFVFPTQCPECETTLVEDGVAVRCPSANDCPAQLRRKLLHFAGKSGVQIGGLGESTVAALVKSGCVRDVSDLYRLRDEDLRGLPGIGEKTATRLLREIDESRRAELWRFIYALGIPRIGTSSSKSLAKNFNSLEQLNGATRDQLRPVVGQNAADAMISYFADPKNQERIRTLRALGVNPMRAPAQ